MAVTSERTVPSSSRLAVRPTGAGLGAEIVAIDLRRIDDGDFAAICRAFVEHSVLLFRGQRLSDDDLIAFSRRFGDLDWAPVQETGRRFVEGMPEIYIVSNVIVNGVSRSAASAPARRCGTPTCPISTCRRWRACCTRSRCRPPAATLVLQHVRGLRGAAGRR